MTFPLLFIKPPGAISVSLWEFLPLPITFYPPPLTNTTPHYSLFLQLKKCWIDWKTLQNKKPHYNYRKTLGNVLRNKKQELILFGIGNIFFHENYNCVYYLWRDWWSKTWKHSRLDISTQVSILRPWRRNVRNKVTHSKPAFNTGRFIMFSVITNIYNKKTKGPTLMELFTAIEKLKKFFFDN